MAGKWIKINEWMDRSGIGWWFGELWSFNFKRVPIMKGVTCFPLVILMSRLGRVSFATAFTFQIPFHRLDVEYLCTLLVAC